MNGGSSSLVGSLVVQKQENPAFYSLLFAFLAYCTEYTRRIFLVFLFCHAVRWIPNIWELNQADEEKVFRSKSDDVPISNFISCPARLAVVGEQPESGETIMCICIGVFAIVYLQLCIFDVFTTCTCAFVFV